MKLLKTTLMSTTLILSGAVYAGPGHGTDGHEGMVDMQGMSHDKMSEGTVKKINPDAGKIMIEHGPLYTLNMPAMTMVFLVQDRSLLDQVSVGDKINFIAENIDGKPTVTKLEPAK
ncbi:MAG: copper-binding protein [Gammaproteobacteria bacterium]|nr:copper-binding protein [Gammaproteobacteria bacterium]